jgi:ATP-binding cassette subfamily F protein 2
MPSDYQKKKLAKKKEAAKQKGGKKPTANDVEENGDSNGTNGEITDKLGLVNGSKENSSEKTTYEEELCARLENEARLASEARACTGVLGIHPMSKDIKMDNFSVTFHGAELIQDSKVELSCGRKYGLIGVNGSGKSSFLAVLGNREVPIQTTSISFTLLARCQRPKKLP